MMNTEMSIESNSLKEDTIVKNETNKIILQSINNISEKMTNLLEAESDNKDYSKEILNFLKTEKEQTRNFINDLQNQIKYLNEERNEMMSSHSKKISELQIQISNFENKNKLLEDEKLDFISKIQQMDKLKNDFFIANSKLEILTKELEEKNKLEKEFIENKKTLNALSIKYDNLEKHNIELQEKLDKVNVENKQLSETCANYDNQLEDAKNEVNKLKNDIIAQTEQTEKVTVELNYYTSNDFTSLKEAYALFTNFSKRTRDNMQAIFQTDSFTGFISNALQWDRIAAIWEQAKRKIVKNDMEDFNELRRLFLILFKIYNSGYTTPIYSLLNPEIGSKYNSDNMIIINDKSNGIVKEVLLEGYMYIETNKVHDALVLVD